MNVVNPLEDPFSIDLVKSNKEANYLPLLNNLTGALQRSVTVSLRAPFENPSNKSTVKPLYNGHALQRISVCSGNIFKEPIIYSYVKTCNLNLSNVGYLF